jgi:hypothetical protein
MDRTAIRRKAAAMTPRKIWLLRETIFAEANRTAPRPVTRAVVAMVVANPLASGKSGSLDVLIDLGPSLAERYYPQAVALLPGPALAYGKAAIVGVNGDLEHGAAVIHPKLGKAMRATVGGGEAIIASTCKVASAGSRIDVPLGHKDNVWSFNELDTITIGIEDAPRPDEILVVLAVSDGGRPDPRIGPGRLAI